MGRASVIQFTAPAEEAGAGQVAAWIAAAEADGEWWGEGVTAPWLEGVYDPTPGELLAALDACRVPAVTGGPDVAVGGAAGAVGAGGAGGVGGAGGAGAVGAGGGGAVGAGGAGEAAGAGCAGEGLEVVVDLATWRLGVSRERVRGHHNTGGAAATAAAATAAVGMNPAPVGPVALDVTEAVPAAPTADAADVAPAAPFAAAVPTATNDAAADAALGAVAGAGAAGVADAAADASTAAAPSPTPAAAAAAAAVPTVAGGGAATAAVGPAEAASAATPGDPSAAAPVVDAAAPVVGAADAAGAPDAVDAPGAASAPDAAGAADGAGAASAPDAAAADGAGAASGGGVAGWVRREWVQAPMCQEVRELLGLVPGPGLVAALSVIGRRSRCDCGRSRLAADIDVGGLRPVPGVTAGLPCACQVILTAAWQAVEGWAQVAAMAAVVDAAAPEPVVSTPNLVHRARVTDGVCSELAGALALTTAGAAGRIATARDLYRFPDLVALAEEGIVIAPVWRAVLGESTNLPADARQVVVGQMVAKIRTRHAAGKAPWTPSQARQMTRYAVLRLTPAIQDEARRNAFAGRRVTVTPAGDGMAWVSILMPDTDAFRVGHRLRSIANAIKADDPTDGRSAAQRQADVAIDLLLARTSPTGHPAGCDCGCCPTNATPTPTTSTTGAGAVEDAETGPDADDHTDSATATGCVGVRCARCGRCAHHRCTCPTSTADTDTDADAVGDAGAGAVTDAAGGADVADGAHSDAGGADDSGVADSEDAAEIEVIDTGADDAVTDAVPSTDGDASAHTDSSADDDASASVVDEGTADADPDVEADADADAGAEVGLDAAGDCTEGAGDEIEVIDESGSADLGSTGATDVDAEDNAEEEASATVPGDTTVDTETTAAATADPKPPADADADAEVDADAGAEAGADAEVDADAQVDAVAGAEVDADADPNNASGAQTDAAGDPEHVAGVSEWMREVYAALDANSNNQRTDDTADTIEAATAAAPAATTVDVVDVEGDALPVLGQPTATDLQPTTVRAPVPVVIDALGEPYESDPYAGVDDDRDLPPDPDPPPPWWSAQVRLPDPSHTGELCPNPVATHPATTTNPSQQLRPAHLFNPARPLPPDPSDTGELCPQPVAGQPATTNPSPATGCGPIPAAATSPCPGAGAGVAQAPAAQPQPQPQQRSGQQALLEAEASTGPVPRSARPEISVVVDLPTLLGLAHNPAVVPGMGPIDAATARALAAEGTWRLLITDPATGAVVATSARTYTPTAAVARLVRAREPYCRAPGCRRQAVNSDLDHTTPWPDGDTTAANLGPLCRVHHNLKTHHGHHLTNLTTTTTSSSTSTTTSSPAGTASADAASTASTSAPANTPGDPTTGDPSAGTTPTLTGWRWTLPSGLTHTHHPEPPLPE